MESIALDAAGHRRSPATMPGYHHGRSPRNKGLRYPADPPTIDEIVAVVRTVGDKFIGLRLRALIVLLWRAGLRVGEALALAETDLDRSRGAVLVRCGKGGKRREVGMDRWAWQQLEPWLQLRRTLPVGTLLCVIHGPTAGRTGKPQLLASSFTALQPPPASDDGSLRTSSDTRCDRDGPRGRSARRDPAATRARQPEHYLGVPPGHRQLGDHRHSPRQTGTHDQRDSGPRHPLDHQAAGAAQARRRPHPPPASGRWEHRSAERPALQSTWDPHRVESVIPWGPWWHECCGVSWRRGWLAGRILGGSVDASAARWLDGRWSDLGCVRCVGGGCDLACALE